MKKILSTLLVAAMLLSMVIIVSVPTAAVDGEWTTYGPASESADGYSGDPTSVPGYEYTDDGLHVIPANWDEQVVYGTVQTKNPVDIEDGVYLEFRVDKFDGMTQDNWFSITLWDSKNVEPGQTIYGTGVMTLNRVLYDETAGKYYYGTVDWYTDGFTTKGQTCEKDDKDANIKKYLNDDGSFTMTLEIKKEGGALKTYINGAAAPDSVNEYITTNLGKDGKFNDGAYIGVTYRHGNTGGTVDMTITKFGTSKDDATTPEGDDSKDPIDNSEYHVKAPIADASTIPAGQPCFVLTGNLADSATKKFYGNQGGVGSVNDDFSMHIAADGAWTSFIIDVKNDVSYDIDDFPVMMMLTKDFCMCDDPEDCYAVESISGHLMTGKEYAAGNNKFPELEICWEPIIVEEGDKAGQYLYFSFDFSDDLLFVSEGRINSIRFDVSGLKYQEAGRGAINVVFVAFFRTVEEAEEYVLNYLEGDDNSDTPVVDETTAPAGEETTEAKGEETNAPVVDETTAPVVDETTAPAGDETTAPVVDETTAPAGEETTEAKGEETTKPKNDKVEDDDEDEDEDEDDKGCGSVIGAGAAAVVALVTLGGAVVLRKKED